VAHYAILVRALRSALALPADPGRQGPSGGIMGGNDLKTCPGKWSIAFGVGTKMFRPPPLSPLRSPR